MEMNKQLQTTVIEKTPHVSHPGSDLINSLRFKKGTAFSDRERDVSEPGWLIATACAQY
jgi:hypothetical protein